MSPTTRSSSGHKLGQIVGDWFEEDVAIYLLSQVAKELNLFLDNRFRDRSCRGNKILWKDLDGNRVDYDFVLELNGSDEKQGIPVAFFETFWRRGARHSKDKARDDSGKLMPMRATYPTARVLGILAAGDFTQPAQELVQSRGIDLFYIPKNHICSAWLKSGIEIDYPDTASEQEKNRITNKAISLLTSELRKKLFKSLVETVGKPVLDSYVKRIIAGVAAIPIEFRIANVLLGDPVIFKNHKDAAIYLSSTTKQIDTASMARRLRYEAIYSDGSIFQRDDLNIKDALKLHEAVGLVATHFTEHHAKK